MSTILSKTLQALSDPTRREILRLLQEKDLTAGQIAENFAISAPSVSHHLGILKAAALVTSQRDGQTIVYTLNATVVQEFLQSLVTLFSLEKPDTAAAGKRRSRANRNET